MVRADSAPYLGAYTAILIDTHKFALKYFSVTIMSSDPQLEELERFEALILAYYVDLYHECLYTDEE
ncbi:unnamed protein product [Ectocarpus sp. CCAP 1310/34]|nr:unnamed protein product [Ectocarpus sp. CCAP 1310/34]